MRKGYPLARVTVASRLPFLLVNRALDMNINYGELCAFSKEGWQRPLFQTLPRTGTNYTEQHVTATLGNISTECWCEDFNSH